MLQSLDKQTDKCPYCDLTECHYRKANTETDKLTKLPSIFNEGSVGWNLNKRNACKSIISARLMD